MFTLKSEYTYGYFYEFNPSNGIDRKTNVQKSFDKLESDSVTGNFKDPNNYSRTRTYESSFEGKQLTFRPNGTLFSSVEGVLPPSQFPYSLDLVPPDESLYNTALERMYEQLRGSIDLSIDLLQYKQVLATTGSLSRSMESLTRQLASAYRRYGSAKKFAKVAASLWLQWQYGIKPTVSTLYDLVEYANTPMNPAVYCKGTAKTELRSTKNTNAGSDGQVKNNMLFQKARVRAWFYLNPSSLQDLGRLSSLNPLSIGWELLPLSFVLDWAIDIGGYIRSMESAFLYGGSCKLATAENSYLWMSTCYKRDYVNDILTDIRQSSRRSAYNRVVLPSAPIPKLPPLEVRLGWQRLLSAASLLAQTLPDHASVERETRKIRASKLGWT